MDKLDTIFRLQKDLASLIASERYPSTVEERVSCLSTAITHEAIELQRLTNWKAREELIDIWHFVIQASIELNISPQNILDEYRRKNKINRQRHREGY